MFPPFKPFLILTFVNLFYGVLTYRGIVFTWLMLSTNRKQGDVAADYATLCVTPYP